MDLRPYQRDAIQRLRQSLAAGRRRPVLMASMGAGKTVMAGTMVQSAVAKGHRVLFLVDAIELASQAVATFERLGLSVGVFQAKHPLEYPSRPVQVGTVQTVSRRMERHPEQWGPESYPIGLVIVDECDIQHKGRDMVAAAYPGVPIIGLSATPFSRGLGRFYDDLVQAVSTQQLVDDGFLVPIRAFAPSRPDMTGVALDASGDWAKDAAAERYDDELRADILRSWQTHARGRATLGFACNVAHSRQLAAEFAAAGIRSAHVDGYGRNDEERAERQATIAAFKRGEIDVLWNVGICGRGFDAPICSAIIVARPTKSLSLHLQIWGRAMRVGGHPDSIVLDHAGSCERLGFPTDPLPDELDDGTKKRSESVDRKPGDAPLPKPCPKCAFMKPPGTHACPACKFAPERQASVSVADGELEEVKPTGKASKAEKQRWWSELSGYAAERGKSDKWVLAKYKAKFGVWPRGLDDVRAAPSADVKGWLTSQAIAYAKSQRRASA